MQAESDTTVSVVAGEGDGALGTGSVVLISTSGTTVSQTGGWTYVARGVISSVAPSQGQVGTWVTISGSRLLGAGDSIVQVQLGGVPAAQGGYYQQLQQQQRWCSSGQQQHCRAWLCCVDSGHWSCGELGGGSGRSSVTFGNVSCTIVYANDSLGPWPCVCDGDRGEQRPVGYFDKRCYADFEYGCYCARSVCVDVCESRTGYCCDAECRPGGNSGEHQRCWVARRGKLRPGALVGLPEAALVLGAGPRATRVKFPQFRVA